MFTTTLRFFQYFCGGFSFYEKLWRSCTCNGTARLHHSLQKRFWNISDLTPDSSCSELLENTSDNRELECLNFVSINYGTKSAVFTRPWMTCQAVITRPRPKRHLMFVLLLERDGSVIRSFNKQRHSVPPPFHTDFRISFFNFAMKLQRWLRALRTVWYSIQYPTDINKIRQG